MMRITSMRNKIFFLAEDQVAWFKPDEHEAEAVTLTSSDLHEITGWNEGFVVIGIFCSQQSTGRHEFWTVTEDRTKKRLGLEVYWTEGDEDDVALRMGSENWNHKQEN